MDTELRVPVARVDVELAFAVAAAATGQGVDVRPVTIFLPPDGAVSALLEGRPEAFVPAEEKGRVRFFLRGAILTVTYPAPPAPLEDDDGLPRNRRRVLVRLTTGAGVEGELRWVPTSPSPRTMDVLNQDAAAFAIHRGDGSVVYVAKRHVLSVQEIPS